GAVREFELLAEGGVSIEGDGHRHRPWGLDGGARGPVRTGRSRLSRRLTYQNKLSADSPARLGEMSGERVQRRLAAILAADVAGYSRLVEQDEAGTVARLRTHRRELIDPKIAEHKGRIVKTTGDGMLVEFPSVVEAVACAVAVQRGMAER